MGVQSQRPNASRWDTKKKKFIQGDGTGSDNKKLIRTESGLKLPASFRSGRFDEWRKEKRVEMPKVGETEKESLPAALRAGPGGGGSGGGRGRGGKVFRHNSNKEAKPLDPLAKDYHRKLASAYRKRGEEREAGGSAGAGGSGGARGGRGGAAGRGGRGGRGAAPGRGGARVRNELKSAMDIQKERALTAKRKAKNARGGRGGGRSGSRGGGGGGGGRGRARSGRSR